MGEASLARNASGRSMTLGSLIQARVPTHLAELPHSGCNEHPLARTTGHAGKNRNHKDGRRSRNASPGHVRRNGRGSDTGD